MDTAPREQSERPQDIEMEPAPDLIESIALEAVAAEWIPKGGWDPSKRNRTGGQSQHQMTTVEPDRDCLSETEPIGLMRPTPWSGAGSVPIRSRRGSAAAVWGASTVATRVEDFAQQVAIKLIKRGMDSDAIVRRFQTEIHVQAALGKHPNIAALLDAGSRPRTAGLTS